MEVLAHKIADKIALQLDIDEDENAVIAYGLIGLLQITTIFMIITSLGIIFGFLYESLIIFLSVAFMRKSTGGAHSRTMMGCNVISILSILFLSALSRYVLSDPLNIYINLGSSIVIFLISFIVFYIRVPVDNPNKPIVKPEKIKRLRNQSFIKLILFFSLSMISIKLAYSFERFYSISASIRLVMLWQAFTLTKTGALVLDKIDSKVNWILDKR